MYNDLQLREIFHLEFLRWLGRAVKSDCYALKGGVNLRFFFKSFRYSEDMDLDAHGVRKDILAEAVMKILNSPSFQNTFKPYGIERVVPPNIAKAKQTETTQRFKIHLATYSGEDLFTKIEFSKRGFTGNILTAPVSDNITRAYKVPPVIIPHYDINSAVKQKAEALRKRSITQARDIFDIYILSSQYKHAKEGSMQLAPSKLKEVSSRIYDVDFETFRDTVLAFLSDEEKSVYNKADIWGEIKLKTVKFLEELA